jgi:beta-1,2-mannobiose phosphorylase / 1,2-beta-oligomannan phosphorylase
MFIVNRDNENPLLAPRREHPWEALAAFNPSVVKRGDTLRMYYRAMANPQAIVAPYSPQSTIGLAESKDGTHFSHHRQVIAPMHDWEAFGCEDPRATVIDGVTYLSYTALGGYPYGPENIKAAMAISHDGEHFEERHLLTPFNAKAFALFPEKIQDEYAALVTVHTDFTPEHPRPTIGIARAKSMEDFWNPEFWKEWHEHLSEHALPNLRRSDDDHVEIGAPPVKTRDGWLLLYSYTQRYYDEAHRMFGVEALLLDHDDPRILKSRTYPFMVAEEVYERFGIVPNIVFPSGTLSHEDTLDLYYGAADTTCARARLHLPDLLAALSSTTEPTFVRFPDNPILVAGKNAFENKLVFNPAAFELDGKVHILYRAMDTANTSTVGYAVSTDGFRIDERLPVPIYGPRAPFEMKQGKPDGNSGCEDPRVVVIDDRLYMTYTAYDGVHPPVGAITSISLDDFRARAFDKWSEPMLVTPDDVDDKDLALLPEKREDGYLLYHRVSRRVCADVLPDLVSGKRVSKCIEIMGPREGLWDSEKVGVAAPPVKVHGGWLLFYHGVSHRSRYRVGAALLDEQGTTVIARSADPLFEPETPYEKEGEVGNVVFPCGVVVRGDTVFMYYGGGDKVVGVATASLSRIVHALTPP